MDHFSVLVCFCTPLYPCCYRNQWDTRHWVANLPVDKTTRHANRIPQFLHLSILRELDTSMVFHRARIAATQYHLFEPVVLIHTCRI